MSRVRIRQHVNPLSSRYQKSLTLPDWSQIYTHLHQPLHLDIGCGRGNFLLQMSQLQPDVNFLGIEIREPLVIEANRQKEELGLTNLHYLFGNINNSAEILLSSLPSNILSRVTIQFPDPWFKKKHKKRRIVQPGLVDILANYLVDDGEVFLQSDIEEVAKEMRDRFNEHSSFRQQHRETWLAINPLPVPTERELYVISHDEPVYRALFKKIARS
ncbi:tRNA (guanosine(46)-N7)-methyltransferase TrmB [Pleurocapsales cyanobacterium LEGE 06147]|nr:tRNA (guanosine(46)-N7)-methyltransferase TrmB [Pleurocapsales cyanobacterium LEGE 06147]